MKIRLTVMLLVVAALLPSTASGQAKGDRQKINDGEFARQVNSAIDKGVAWLRKQQRADGSWADRKGFEGGQTALSLLALSASGVHADDPVMKKGFEHLLQQPLSKTYVVAVTVMALAATAVAALAVTMKTATELAALMMAPTVLVATAVVRALERPAENGRTRCFALSRTLSGRWERR